MTSLANVTVAVVELDAPHSSVAVNVTAIVSGS